MEARFLDMWDCATGNTLHKMPDGFVLQKGDYLALMNWHCDGIRYKPSGPQIIGDVETLKVSGNVGKCVYMWDGNEWNLTLPEADDDSVNVRLNYYELDILLDGLAALGGHRDLYDKLFMAHDEAWKVRK